MNNLPDRRDVLKALAVALILFCGRNEVAATPDSATVYSFTYGNLNSLGGPAFAVGSNESWGPSNPPTNPLSSSATWNAKGFDLTNSNSISATFSADGNSGSIIMGDDFTGNLGGIAAYGSDGSFWSYTFTADATGEISMSYDTKQTSYFPDGSSQIGAGPFNNIAGSPFTTHLFSSLGNGESIGVETGTVIQGQTYTIGVQDVAGNAAYFYGQEYVESGVFNFTLPGNPPAPSTSVPDAASTLPLLGGALAGLAALRRRFAK